MFLLDKGLKHMVRKGQLTVIAADGTRRTYGTPDPDRTPIVLRFTDRRVAREIGRNPRLKVGEAYMDGRLIFERGDIAGLIDLAAANGRWEDVGADTGFLRHRWKRLHRWFAARNYERRARANVAHHYDLGNELYRIFLDEDLQYSCAYFDTPNVTLEQAQRDKKAHIAAKLHLKPGMRVLDIGCGWGGMALYLNRVAGVDVTGITLSEQQLALARQRAAAAGVADRVRFELVDYRRMTGRFDRIVSVGMFEHVGAPHYRTFFAKCRELLAPDGVMLLHSIGRFDEPSDHDPFFQKYIFPGYHLPSLSQMVQASETSRLIVTGVETLRLHYAYTLREWLKRTRAARTELASRYDERFVRMWEVYLAGARAMFEHGSGCVFQVQYVRDRSALPITRDYMFEAEQRYRALDPTAPPPPADAASDRARHPLHDTIESNFAV